MGQLGTGNLLDVALRAAREAGEAIMEIYRTSESRSNTLSKSMFADLITAADIAADERIREVLTEAFPEHGILSEETGRTGPASNLLWVIDPLDGTIAYASGLPHFGLSVGLVKDEQPIVGVLHFPLDRTTYWAQQGQGAYLDAERIGVSRVSHLQDAVIGTVYGFEDRRESLMRTALQLVEHTRYVVTDPCITYLFALVASGVLQGCIHHRGASPWDLAAGTLLIQEAGGEVTGMYGERVDLMQPQNGGIVATNGEIHHQILSLLSNKIL